MRSHILGYRRGKKMDTNFYINILKNRLSEHRFSHSLRVVDTALKLGDLLDLDKEKLWLASLFHDYAKDMPKDEILFLARENNLITCTAEELQPDLLHGPVGAFLCKQDLNFRDKDVLQAIYYHTTGHENMTSLDKIVYLSDLLEPGRKYEGIDELRKLCKDNLDNGLLYAFDSVLQYVLKRNFLIHPMTIKARNNLILHIKDLEEWYE